MKKTLSKNGQGALEYLILIGAAILVAVIVVTIIINTSRGGQTSAASTNASYESLVTNTILPPMIISVDCNAASNVATYILNASVSADVNEYCVVQNDVVNITGCQALSNNNVAFTTTLDDGNSYRMSLVAGNGRAYSTPTSPAPTCIAHN